MDLVTLT